MNRTLWLLVSFLLLIGIVVLQSNQGWAVVPYSPIEAPSAEVKLINKPNKIVEKLQIHEVQNTQAFNEIKAELIRIKEQNILIIKEESSWKLVTVALFFINFILLVFLGWILRLKRLK